MKRAKLTPAQIYHKALLQIVRFPKKWNQEHFFCGTSHCMGGWMLILSGERGPTSAEYFATPDGGPYENSIVSLSRLLNLNLDDTLEFAEPCNSLQDLIDFGNKHFNLNTSLNKLKLTIKHEKARRKKALANAQVNTTSSPL